MDNVFFEIQRFNADSRINHLHSMYENSSFMNCLSVSRREMSHSKFLSELLKEDSFHGTGTIPLQLFLETILDRAVKQDTRLNESPHKPVMFPSLKSAILSRSLSLSDIEVIPEDSFTDTDGTSGRVDILITCRVRPLKREDGKPVEYLNLIVENKVSAQESNDQTEKYYKHFNAFLKNKGAGLVDTSTLKGGPRALYNLYVYLTPAAPRDVDALKEPVSKCKECVQICYQDILDHVLDPLLDSKELSQQGKFFIEEYRRSLGVSFDNVEVPDGTGGNTKLKVNTAIMAVGKKESLELCQFWSDYKELLSAAINEKNRQDDDDDSELNEDKRTLYEYKGQSFNMGRLVEAVILDHIADYNTDEMNNLFKDIVGKIILDDDPKSSYFERIEEVRTKDNQTICVFKQWSESGQYKFCDFCNRAKELGWYVMKEYKKISFSPEESLMLVEFYKKCEKLITTAMEVIRYSRNEILGNDIEALMKRTKSHRDRSTFTATLHADNVTVRNLSRGRLVLNVLQDFVDENNPNKDELEKYFALPKNALKAFSPEKDYSSGYFDDGSDMLLLADNKQYLVQKGWSDKALNAFIAAAKEMLYRIEKDSK